MCWMPKVTFPLNCSMPSVSISLTGYPVHGSNWNLQATSVPLHIHAHSTCQRFCLYLWSATSFRINWTLINFKNASFHFFSTCLIMSLSLSLFTITLAFELGLRIQTSSFPRRQNCSVGAQVDGFWLKWRPEALSALETIKSRFDHVRTVITV